MRFRRRSWRRWHDSPTARRRGNDSAAGAAPRCTSAELRSVKALSGDRLCNARARVRPSSLVRAGLSAFLERRLSGTPASLLTLVREQHETIG
jgi:hypothetical protein